MNEIEKKDLLTFIDNLSYQYDSEDLENMNKLNQIIKTNLDKIDFIKNIK